MISNADQLDMKFDTLYNRAIVKKSNIELQQTQLDKLKQQYNDSLIELK